MFAGEQGFSATRLSYWAKQIETADASGVPRFVAVSLPTSGTPASRAAIEIEMAGLTLRVSESADAVYVAQLVAALQTRGVRPC